MHQAADGCDEIVGHIGRLEVGGRRVDAKHCLESVMRHINRNEVALVAQHCDVCQEHEQPINPENDNLDAFRAVPER